MSAPRGGAAVRVAAWTLAWAVLAALADGWLLERWYGVTARLPLHYPELALDALPGALLYAALAGALVRLAGHRGRRRAWDLVAGGLALVVVAAGFVVARGGGGGGTAGFGHAVALAGAGAALALVSPYRRVAPLARGLLVVALAVALGGETLRGPLARWRAARGGGAAARPNVVLVVIDTLRADHLSCHGYPIRTSPAIDALAAGGVRFTRAIAQASWTLPATASIHTGRFPSSHGAVSRGLALPEGTTTLAEALASVGYRTAGFSENQIVSSRYGFAQGFDWFWSYWLPWISGETLARRIGGRLGLPSVDLLAAHEYPAAPTDPAELNWDARRTTDVALEWLEAAASGGAPFFAYLHFMGPHGPYGPPEFLLEGEAPSVRVADHPRDMGGGRPLGAPADTLSPEAYAAVRTLYAADIRYVDREVGRIADALRALGVWEHTILVVTSDHGEEFYEHGGWNHGGSVFQEIVHVPLIFGGGRVAVAGVVRPEPVRHVDLLPTLLDAAGVEAPPSHGMSLWPVGVAEVADARSSRAPGVLVEGCFVRPEGIDGTALFDGGRKLVRVVGADSAATLLFDLSTDPAEQRDLSALDPARLDSLRGELAVWEQAARSFDPGRRDVRLDPETLRALRRLGYLQ